MPVAYCSAKILTWFTNSPSTWTCVGLHILSQLVHQLPVHLHLTWWSIQSFQDLLEFSGSELLCARRQSRNWRGHDDGTSTHTAHSTAHTAHCTAHLTTQGTAQNTQHIAHNAQHTAHRAHTTEHTAHRTQRTQHIAQALPSGAWQRIELRNTLSGNMYTHTM